MWFGIPTRVQGQTSSVYVCAKGAKTCMGSGTARERRNDDLFLVLGCTRYKSRDRKCSGGVYFERWSDVQRDENLRDIHKLFMTYDTHDEGHAKEMAAGVIFIRSTRGK